MNEEKMLGIVKGATEDEIIEVVECEDAIQLRYRQWGSGIGWYTQKSVEIDPSQVDSLVQALQKAKRPEAVKPQSVVVPFRRRSRSA